MVEFLATNNCFLLPSLPGANYDAEMAFWDTSDSSLPDVTNVLLSSTTSNAEKWNALKSGRQGLGILGTWPDSHHVEG